MKNFDWVILVGVLVICGFGAAIIGSVASEVLLSQIIFYSFGLILFFLFSRLDYRIYASLRHIIYIATIILLLITLVLGLESRGAVRWISIGTFRLQFSEIFKPFLVSAFAFFLAGRNGKWNIKQFILTIAWIFVPLFLIFKQPDLGSSLVYAVAFLSMFASSGVNLFYLFASFFGLVISAPVGWRFLAGYQKNRLLSFLSPHIDPLGASYNSIQALITVGSGMIFGRGLGRGTQTQLNFLPERHTDFIFASLAEEMGFIGSVVLLTVYFILIWRIFSCASQSSSPAARYICLGIGVMILTQVFVNVGMNIGVLPVTGITLPLVSYGGSSVLATMIGLGIVENIVSSREIG